MPQQSPQVVFENETMILFTLYILSGSQGNVQRRVTQVTTQEHDGKSPRVWSQEQLTYTTKTNSDAQAV